MSIFNKLKEAFKPWIGPTPRSETELGFSGGKLSDGTRVVGPFPKDWLRPEYSKSKPISDQEDKIPSEED